ncbi:FHA domain-containing protein [Glaciecola sp. MH2013]|uniref:FHA domain-containing protein n=1 Tax=Glaciecola sp. MH2013 TaxID=2785524 RepID=UPI0018A0D81D|nr:FHA domain-containing protein [Glaciecola sp. MH2013]MBF7073067.1 FHA domain-containing protein [Glaciecola sp. MH2013]
MKIAMKAFVLILLSALSADSLGANQWQAILVAQDDNRELNQHFEQIVTEAFIERSITLRAPESFGLDCLVSFCGKPNMRVFIDEFSLVNEALEPEKQQVNLLLFYSAKLQQSSTVSEAGENENWRYEVSLRAIDTLSAVVLFSKSERLNFELAQASDVNEGAAGANTKQENIAIVNQSLATQLVAELLNQDKRYTYHLRLEDYSQQEARILASLLLPSTADIQSELSSEETERAFLSLLLPIQSVEYKVDSPFTPAQFRQQALTLIERLDAPTNFRFVKQDNQFKLQRAHTPYALELVLLWFALLGICLLSLTLVARSALSWKLNQLEAGNQSGKWLSLVNRILVLPYPFLLSKTCLKKKQAIEKRVEQSSMWFENATDLLHNYEVDSASVYVKRAIEQNASNISALALSSAINAQREKNRETKNERKEWKQRVESAVKLAQEGRLYLSLFQAYEALALCKNHEQHDRPVIDFQIDSIKRLLTRLLKNKSLTGQGLSIQSHEQKLIINCNQKLHLGRPSPDTNLCMAVQILLPQKNVSRVGRSAVIECDDHGYSLSDLGSTNGVWFQYIKVRQQHTHRLSAMDQIHLLPPDEMAPIGIQVEHVFGNECLCLSLCQNTIMPPPEMNSAVNFLSSSINTKWYMSKSDFYLMQDKHELRWLSASEYFAKSHHQTQTEIANKALLRLQIYPSMWLFPMPNKSQTHIAEANDILVDGAPLNGPMPLIETLTLQIGSQVFTLNLHDAQPATADSENHIIGETVYSEQISQAMHGSEIAVEGLAHAQKKPQQQGDL